MDRIEVLLVEDNPGDSLLLAEALDRVAPACRLTLLKNGAEALDYLLRRGPHRGAPRPQLVVLDFNLPLANALEIMQEVRQDPEQRDLPFLLLSGSDLDPGLQAALGIPPERCLVKPMTFQGYLDVARNLGTLAQRDLNLA